MFTFLKKLCVRTTPVLIITGKIKYDETTDSYSFWPNYAKGNNLHPSYDIGHLEKHPCKFPNATVIGVFDKRYGTLLSFSNGSDAMIASMEVNR